MFTVAIVDIDWRYENIDGLSCYGTFKTEEEANRYLRKIEQYRRRFSYYFSSKYQIIELEEEYPGIPIEKGSD